MLSWLPGDCPMHVSGVNPLIGFLCILPLLGQPLLINKRINYLAGKKELVHLCAPQDGGVQASAPAASYIHLN